jgi:predicted ester cyclase
MNEDRDTDCGTGDPAVDDDGSQPRLLLPAAELEAALMPVDLSISVAAKRGIDRIRTGAKGGRAQSMRGFEPTYVDIVDYIVRITHRIWEERDIGYIHDTYNPSARIVSGRGLQMGRDQVIADTAAQLAAFGDLRLHADEIIWAGDDVHGFRTSHRVFETGHHTGPSRYGPATGRQVSYWAIANCVVLENEIVEEWVLSDTVALLRQLDLDPLVVAREQGAVDAQNPRAGETERGRGQTTPPDPPIPDRGTEDPRAFEHWLHDQLWNRRNLSVVDAAYDCRVRITAPGGRRLYGRGDVKGRVLELLAMFPDAILQVDEVYWMGNPVDGQLVSTRWSLVGTHRGHGPYGRPTGRRADAWGITQHLIRDGQIVEEWTVSNEFDVLCGLLA